MKKLIILFLGLILFAGGCGKKVIVGSGGLDSINQSLKIIHETLNKNLPSEDYRYYKTFYSDNFRMFAFVWVHKSKDKFFIRTAEVFGNNPKVYIRKSLSTFYVKVTGGTVYGCYGTSISEPELGNNTVKVDWNILDRNECDQSIKIPFKNKQDAEEFAQAFKFLLNQHEEEPDLFDKIRNGDEKMETKEKIKNKCSVDKILKMKGIGLTKEEIKKICE